MTTGHNVEMIEDRQGKGRKEKNIRDKRSNICFYNLDAKKSNSITSSSKTSNEKTSKEDIWRETKISWKYDCLPKKNITFCSFDSLAFGFLSLDILCLNRFQ